MLMKEINDLKRMQDMKQTEYCTVVVTLYMLGNLPCCKTFFKIYVFKYDNILAFYAKNAISKIVLGSYRYEK